MGKNINDLEKVKRVLRYIIEEYIYDSELYEIYIKNKILRKEINTFTLQAPKLLKERIDELNIPNLLIKGYNIKYGKQLPIYINKIKINDNWYNINLNKHLDINIKEKKEINILQTDIEMEKEGYRYNKDKYKEYISKDSVIEIILIKNNSFMGKEKNIKSKIIERINKIKEENKMEKKNSYEEIKKEAVYGIGENQYEYLEIPKDTYSIIEFLVLGEEFLQKLEYASVNIKYTEEEKEEGIPQAILNGLRIGYVDKMSKWKDKINSITLYANSLEEIYDIKIKEGYEKTEEDLKFGIDASKEILVNILSDSFDRLLNINIEVGKNKKIYQVNK